MSVATASCRSCCEIVDRARCSRRCWPAGSTSAAPGCRTSRAPPLLQPYRMLHKLFNKDSVVADNASPLFRAAPYIVFGCMALACAIVPTLSTDLPLAPAADAIALVGLFALARVFISLAAMDIGTAFGTLGARREMLVGFLAEPALLMVLFSRLADLAVDLARRRSSRRWRTASSRSIRASPSPASPSRWSRWPRTRASRSTTRRRTSS